MEKVMDFNPLTNLDNVQPENLDTGPIIVLNLLKFKSEDSVSSYLDYAANFFKSFGSKGVEVLYAGSMKEQLQGDIGDWDALALVRYPTRRVFYEMFRSKEYQSFSHYRENALDDAVVWPSEALMPYKTQAVEFDGGDWLPEIQSRFSK